MRAIQISEFGGPEVLKVVDVPDPVPRDGWVPIEVSAAGLNYADTHQAENSYLSRQELPLIPGGEVAGVVGAGHELTGRRVVALVGSGGYAERAVAHPSAVFEIPDDVDDATALALVVQGTSAWHLLRTSAHLAAGESVVVHSAAGGVGTLAVQLAQQWGAGRVVATASSVAKRELAVDLGADVAVDVTGLDADAVRDLLRDAAGGSGPDVVLEMIGGAVFDGSFAALAPFGRLVVFGMAGRTPGQPVAPASLMATSRAVVGFWLVHAQRAPGGLQPAMEELFSLVRAHRLRAVLGGTYPLAEAAEAHQALRSRGTTGKLVLDVRR